ncbi:MAG TPA: GNAT family N-acetyltransferase [Rubrivivax sp.]|nr:GNAT family N-acetyltransferase [Burkholderiales bacterium]HNT39884.1 GNAT family N-acetyltransferase [Rubrivivax sp.]
MNPEPTRPRARARKSAAPAGAEPVLRVRTVRASDMAAVIALDATVTGLHKAAYWQRVFKRYGNYGQGQRQFLVATLDEQVCGFVIGEVRDWEFGAPPCGWVFAIDVMPSARQLGIGARMLADLVARFRREGVHTLRTMTSSSNSLLQSFFRSQGMRAGHLLPLEMDLSAYPLEGRGVDDEERAA